MTEDRPDAPLRVLLVDDEVNILRSLQRLLRKESYEVETTTSPQEALQWLEERTFAVLVSDQRMPEMLGTELLRRARDVAPDTVRIVLTGYTDMEAALKAINEGAIYQFLSKPWEDGHLRTTLRRAVQQYELHAENERLRALTARQNEELRTLSRRLIGQSVSKTLEANQLSQEIGAQVTAVLDVLSEIIEWHSESLSKHSRRVADLSRRVAETMGLSEEEVEEVTQAGHLHDLGKLRLPASWLTEGIESWSVDMITRMRLHPIQGAQMLAQFGTFGPMVTAIRHHHEHVDGTGYPDGLTREEIPLGARIIAVANAFDHAVNPATDAVTVDPSEAFVMLLREAGTRFDPEVVEAMEEVLNQQDLGYMVEYDVEISVESVEKGMTLTGDVLSYNGAVFLKSGNTLTGVHVQQLRRLHREQRIEELIRVRRAPTVRMSR